MSNTVVIKAHDGHGCLVQVLWFLFIGWWLGQIWIAVSWVLMLTVVGIPFGVMMLNRIPQIMALRGQQSAVTVTHVGGVTVVSDGGSVPQHNIVLRAIYFVLIGWWLSAIVMEVAYVLCMTIIGMPLGFRIVRRGSSPGFAPSIDGRWMDGHDFGWTPPVGTGRNPRFDDVRFRRETEWFNWQSTPTT